ncbi:MAG: YajG family lipoprotein [Steroidobacteraceae bacterium]
MRKTTLVSLICLVSACAVSKVDPLAVPLAYKAEARAVPVTASTSSCLALSRVEVEDRRSDKLLGVRFHESKPLKADVTAASDPAAWVRDGMQTILSAKGLPPAPSGPKLLVELRALRTEENIWHRSGYAAKISLIARVQSPSGKVCMEQFAEGKGGNYGYSGSIENYQETLNSALDDATQHILDSPLLENALCHCGS